MALILLEVSHIEITVSIPLITETVSHVSLPASLIDANNLLFGNVALLHADLIDRFLKVYSHSIALLEALFSSELPDINTCIEVVSCACLGLGEIHGAKNGVLINLALTFSQTCVYTFAETLLQHDVAWLNAHVTAQKGSFLTSQTT